MGGEGGNGGMVGLMVERERERVSLKTWCWEVSCGGKGEWGRGKGREGEGGGERGFYWG